MWRKKIRKVSEEAWGRKNEEDRISDLPIELKHHIYSFLDSREAVQSSVLSSIWRDTWKTGPHLNFKIQRPINNIPTYIFPTFVHRFLSNRVDEAGLTTVDFRSLSIKLSLLKETLIYAMSHRTRKINIEFMGDKATRRGGFDISLLKSRFLQDLRLAIDFELIKTPSATWDLPSLTSLTLEGVTFKMCSTIGTKSSSLELFSHFPNLKTLILAGCRLLYIDSFVIKSSGLTNLSLIDLNHSSEFTISAPNLLTFTYYGMARFSLSAMDLDSLQTVNFHTIYHRALQKQPDLVELMIKAFKQLRKAKSLTVNSDVVRFLSGYPELLERRCPFMWLTSLTLVEHRLPPSSIVFSDVIAYFRSSCPGLRVNIEIGVAPWKIRCIDCL